MDVLEFQKWFGFVWNTVQQEVVRAIEKSGQPGIFILEAQMGAGKTKAALAGAELIDSKLGCRGIFFGLPTQATASKIFPRLKQWAQRQSEQARHGIQLAHGMAELNEEYQPVFHGTAVQNEDVSEKGLIVHPWLERRKQALLSEFVIGTVDQLLMAALKQRHVMLRYLGLAGKVVVVNECHAYDAYMNRYLDRALNWLSTYGVPVILLSATLPDRRRRDLIFAYQNTTIPKEERLDWKESQAYPLLTWTGGTKVRQRNIQVDQTPRLVQMEQADRQQIPTLIKHTVSKEGCVGIVVNTVRLAALLQAWGSDSRFETRRTGREPTKSGAIGLLAATLGRSRADSVDDLCQLWFGERVDQEGQLLRDFHTAHQRDKTAYVTEWYYLCEAVFWVGLESEDRVILQTLEQALRAPAFPLFLGRRSCPPTLPIALGFREGSLVDELKQEPWLASQWTQRQYSEKPLLRLLTGSGYGGRNMGMRRDLPVTFHIGARSYAYREMEEHLPVAPPDVLYDPMAELP